MCFLNVPTCRMYLHIETACCGCSAQAASLHSQYHRCVSPGPSTLTESPGSERFPADRQTQQRSMLSGTATRENPKAEAHLKREGQRHHATDDLCAKSLLTFSWNRAPLLITTPPTVGSLNIGDLEKSKCADRENRVCVHRGW